MLSWRVGDKKAQAIGRFPISCLKVLLALCIIGLSSCGSPPPEEQVGQRALERWQALIQGDFKKAYGYLSPGYRAVTSFPIYHSHIGGAVRWKEATLKEVSCADTVCDVIVTIRYQYTAQPVGEYKGERPLKETWVRVDNKWWFLPEK